MFIHDQILSNKKIEKKIIELLNEDVVNEEFIISKFLQLDASEFNSVYGKLLKILSHLDFSDKSAKKTWKEILKNQKLLSKKIGRDIGFRVAMLDYFTNVNKKIKNPKVIEIKLYLETEKLILLDVLTEVYNRRYFQGCIEREFKQAKRYERPLSIIIFDIDNFKKINDFHGHTKGDWVLKRLGEILKKNTRIEDSVCRIGGEEFAVIMPETSTEDAAFVGNKIKEAFSEIPFESKRLTLSGGVATFPLDCNNLNKLIEIADKALYFAKYSGKDKIISASTEKRNEFRFPVNWELLYNISNREFETYTENVSIIGTSFKVNKKVNVGDILSLGFKNNEEKLNCKAKVIWNVKNRENQYQIGAEFLDLKISTLSLMKKKLECT